MNKLKKYSLGVVGIGIVLSVVFVPAINRWSTRATGPYTVCQNRLEILYSAFVEYAAKHEGRLPAADRWCDEIAVYLPNKENGVDNYFVCPFDQSKGERISSYAMNVRISSRVLSKVPKDTVLIFETQPGWNQSGGPADLSSGNSQYGKDAIRCGVLFVDGTVALFQKDPTAILRWEP